jgi:hypothetical protein
MMDLNRRCIALLPTLRPGSGHASAGRQRWAAIVVSQTSIDVARRLTRRAKQGHDVIVAERAIGRTLPNSSKQAQLSLPVAAAHELTIIGDCVFADFEPKLSSRPLELIHSHHHRRASDPMTDGLLAATAPRKLRSSDPPGVPH